MDRFHQLGADVEEALEEGDVAADHLAQVVAGREGRAGGLQDDDLHARPGARAPQRVSQVLHELEAQCVALVGSVEGDVHRGLVLVDQHGGGVVASVLMAPTIRRLPSAGERQRDQRTGHSDSPGVGAVTRLRDAGSQGAN